MHRTEDCPFSHVPVEWHEFYDAERDHVFYCNPETNEVTWKQPHLHDVVFWHCDSCKILIPAQSASECVECHKKRPTSFALAGAEKMTGSETKGETKDDDDDDDGNFTTDVAVELEKLGEKKALETAE